MGAVFNTYKADGQTKTEVEQWYRKACEEAAWSCGHEYSGEINMTSGIKIEDKEFGGEKEADEYLIDACEKWENAVAVKITPPDKPAYWHVGAWCAS